MFWEQVATRVKLSRRHFIAMGLAGGAATTVGYSRFVAPRRLYIRRMKVGSGTRRVRLVHFSDFHFKEEKSHSEHLINTINEQSPDLVFFTGDLVEHKRFAGGAFSYLEQIKAPLYGCPGNHDLVSGVSVSDLKKCFSKTGGDWLWQSNQWVTLDGITLSTVYWWRSPPPSIPPPTGFRILLCHYPAFIDQLPRGAFDLVLSGHSHGGQVRIPGYGALLLPYGVGPYELGQYQHPSGLLNVTAGVGWVHTPCRLFCPPEIVVIDLYI